MECGTKDLQRLPHGMVGRGLAVYSDSAVSAGNVTCVGRRGGYVLMHAERASVSRRLPRSVGTENAPAEKGRTSTRGHPPSSLHALSVRGADHPSSRYHPLRFCLSAMPTCRYLPLLDIAFHALHNARYPILKASAPLHRQSPLLRLPSDHIPLDRDPRSLLRCVIRRGAMPLRSRVCGAS
jgi:hypothetical protein